ncbi:hypothetical protein PTKIN_Ptkin12aG0033000 [Pterospermum kingtungense]
MEYPFKHFLSTEGCSSNESGWTRYIVSHMQDDVDDDGDGNSDDSTVSDASSAPSYHQYNKHKDGRAGNRNNVPVQHDKGDYSTSKRSSHKEAEKGMKKNAENSGKSKKRLGGQGKYGK